MAGQSNPPVALTIAGSDSSGGAGVQADLKTFSSFGVYGASVLTALTAQNTRGVKAIAEVDPDFVGAQLDAVLDDLDVRAAKTGMLANAAVLRVVASRLRARPVPFLIIDPVLSSTSGSALLEPSAIAVLKAELLPLASLITPNILEAETLTGLKISGTDEMRHAAKALVDAGANAALIKGGHLEGPPIDVLYNGSEYVDFPGQRIAGVSLHGAGCTLSAAIAAGLALGSTLRKAVGEAKAYVTEGIRSAPQVGRGSRPLNHLAVGRPRPAK